MLHRSRRVGRGLLRRVDHRSTRAAVARDGAAGTTGALNDGTWALAAGTDRTMLGGDTTAVDRAAAPERGTFLADDAAVRPGSSSAVRGAAASPRRGGSASLAAQTGPTRHRLGRWVAAQRIAAATQGTDAALAADTQARAATSTRLASDTDTP
jgi:hypothetical protein